MIKDSFDFINKNSLIKLEKDDFMIYIDVESLFTNVPIDETIEIIKNAFFKKKSQNIIKLMNLVGAKRQKNITTQGNIRNGTSEYEGDLNGLPWEHFEFLLRNVLQESIFMFNNKLYTVCKKCKNHLGILYFRSIPPFFSYISFYYILFTTFEQLIFLFN